jgi:glucuronate isomerase
MRAFLGDDFLLGSESARRLYFDYADGEPIYDYHSHLLPTDIASDRRFDNIAEIWLDGDHYKWRAMRTAGVDEALITGGADDFTRFKAFAEIVPQCIGNPLYHWTHMELKHPFGIADRLLDGASAAEIWRLTRERLGSPDFSARGLLGQFGVRMIGTTDDPIDSLEHHAAMAADLDLAIDVLPTWRPDLLFKPERDDFTRWIEALGAAADIGITRFPDLLDALTRRLDHFDAHGCVSSDHGFDRFEFVVPDGRADALFARRLRGDSLTADELVAWRSALAVWLGQQYAERGWVMQLHIGAQRDNNSIEYERLGPNTGFDSIGDEPYAAALARYLDTLEQDASLPRTILYCLNPRDNEVLATMTGNFLGHGIAGKIQFGSAWWFNDQQDGMRRQLTSLAQMSLLSRFVGMLTDSRSLLSFSRHEYFRRLLCDLIGGWVEAGEAPGDFDLLGGMVRDICGRNTKTYFRLEDAGAGPHA